MKTIRNFDKYSLWTLVLILVVPPVYNLLNGIGSFLDALDKFSIPMWLAFLTTFWLIFTQQLKRNARQVTIYKDRLIPGLTYQTSRQYFESYKSDRKELANLEYEEASVKVYIKFVEKMLKYSAIGAALLKVIVFGSSVL